MNYKFELEFVCGKKRLQMNKKDSEINITDIKGIEATSYSINTASSQVDGAIIKSVKVNPREITITGDIEKNQNETTNRNFLLSFFNPKETGVMYLTRNNVERKINYRVNALDFVTNKMYEDISFTLVLESADDPYFSDARSRTTALTEITPQFTFPLGIVGRGKIMGYKSFQEFMPIMNDGDKETGLEIIVTAKRGNAKNIKLILNDKQFIYVQQDFNRFDKLVINTNPREKSVKFNGKNIIQKIDRNSTFFSLKQGKNILRFECEDGATNIDIDVNFFRKYLGV